MRPRSKVHGSARASLYHTRRSLTRFRTLLFLSDFSSFSGEGKHRIHPQPNLEPYYFRFAGIRCILTLPSLPSFCYSSVCCIMIWNKRGDCEGILSAEIDRAQHQFVWSAFDYIKTTLALLTRSVFTAKSPNHTLPCLSRTIN
jgi:hypothetical protein